MSARTLAIFGFALVALGLVVVVQGADMPLPGNQIGYEPEQPIRFSHQVHAGDLAVPCLYCHSGAEKSRHAGLPAVQVCANCHRFVTAPLGDVRSAEEAEAAAAKAENRAPRPVTVFTPEIRKIYDALALDDRGEPIPGGKPKPVRWVRVHNLPDFVYFDHRSHVNAGVACATCHGPVDAMHRVRQFADLTMGWCVNCHRDVNATGLPDGRPVHAPTDCSTCHF